MRDSTAARACDGCTWTNTGQPLPARTAIAQRPLEPATGAPGQTRVNHYTHARTHARTAMTQRPLEPATGAPGQTRVNHYTHARTHGHHSRAARACDGCTWTNTGQPLHARTHARTAMTQRPLEPATGAPGQTRVNHYTHARPWLNGR